MFCALAQGPKPQMETISVAQGLSSNHATVICQDHQGYVWMGTLGGLNRYDGYKMSVFRHLPGDSTSLPSNIITALHEDQYGMLWVGTNMGVACFDPLSETFTTYASRPGDPKSLGYNLINYIYHDQDGQLWLSTSGGGLHLFDRENRTFSRFLPNEANPDDRVVITEFCADRQRDHVLWMVVWMGEDCGLYSFDTRTKIFTRTHIDLDLANEEIHSVVEDRAGHLWLAMAHGLARFDKASQTVRRFDGDPNAPKEEVITLIEDRQGMIWACGFGTGLHRYDPKKDRFEQYTHDPLDSKSLSSNRVHSIIEDHSGVFWVTTDGGGVCRWWPDPRRFQSLQGDPANPRFAIGGIVTALCEDRSGRLWMGSNWKGVDCFNRRTGRFEPMDFTSGDLRKMGVWVYSLLEDRTGHIWMGTNKQGLFCLDPTQRTFVRYLPDPANPTSLGSKSVRTIREDRQGMLWLGTLEGLDRLNPATGEFTHHRHDPASPASLPSDAVYSLHEDRSGTLWVGTEAGLSRMDRNSGTFQHFLHQVATGSNRHSGRVYNIAEDQAGNIWAGTGRGLYRLRFKDQTDREPQIEYYSESNGLPDNSICGILEDGRGRLWISTFKGLTVFKNPQHGPTVLPDFQYYGLNDGLQGFFEDKSYFKNQQGEMFFGGENGYNLFHPDSIRDNIHVPPVAITGFEKFDTDHPEAGPVAEKGLAVRNEVTISYKNNIFTISFAALDFRNPDKNRYAYQLEGFNDAWVQLGSQHQVTFTNLDPGTYIFRVKGSNDDGIWNETPAVLRIVITPPWWKTWWAYTIYVALMIGGIFGFIRFRLRLLENRTRELEQAVQTATGRISDQNQQLALQAESLRALDQVKSRFFANVSHELRTPLTLMLGPISSVLKNTQLAARDLNLLQIARQNGQNLLALIGEILDLSKMEAGKMELEEAPVAVRPLFLRLAGNFDSYARRLGLQYTVQCECPPDLQVMLDRKKLETVLNNLLSNAFKFTPAGGAIEVSLRVTPSEGSDLTTIKRLSNLDSTAVAPFSTEAPAVKSAETANFKLQTSNFQLFVRDTGRGIHPDDLPHVFERYFQSKQPNAPTEGGTGIGLALCSEYAQLFGGRIWVESALGQGSVFYFEFNVPAALAAGKESGEDLGISPGVPDELVVGNESGGGWDISPVAPAAKAAGTVLVVEDNEHLQTFLRTILSAHYEVIVANNGAEALEQLGGMGDGLGVKGQYSTYNSSLITHNSPLPDLILSDIMMPVMDGFQLLEKIKSDDRYRHIPVVMLTALADAQDKLRALRIGVDDYLLKPFEEDELLARLHNLLQNAQSRMLPEQTGQTEPEAVPEPTRQFSADDLAWLETLEQLVLREMPNFNLSADILAEKLSMSRPTFFRKTKLLTGLTVQQYVAEVRFRTARTGLEQGSFSSVKAAALSVGLKDIEHFSQQFRVRFGRLPSAYL